MRHTTFMLLTLFVFAFAKAQHRGNYNNVQTVSAEMGNAKRMQGHTASSSRVGTPNPSPYIRIELKSLYNVEATDYTAVFNINQVGPSAETTTDLMNERINKAKGMLMEQGLTEDNFSIDVISFIPKYEIEVTKKLFSKTYTEVPVGFELQQNLLINYKDDKLFPKIMEACAAAEIYNLVKVDYYFEDVEGKYKRLQDRLLAKVAEKKEYYGKLGFDLADYDVTMGEQRYYYLPKDFYKSYTAPNNTSMEALEKNKGVERAEKVISWYYEPLSYQGYDIVENAVIDKPVIQLGIDLVLQYVPKPEEPKQPEPVVKTEVKTKTEYYIVSPKGPVDIKKLPTNE